MDNYISSVQNGRIKHVLTLQQKNSERRKQGLFVVEGVRELTHCVESGFEIHSLFWCPEICFFNYSSLHVSNEKVFQVSRNVYERMAYRGSTEGMMALVIEKERLLSNLILPDNALILVLEKVEKPGNLGAVLRSADAAHADAVIVCDPLTDIYNPNLIRSSIGAVFTVPTVSCSSLECIEFLKSKNIQILTAQLQDSKTYFDTDMRCSTAIVMGTESTGLTQVWRDAATAHIRIPMLGRMDSLNVSVSASILLFEAVRQRYNKA